LVQIDLLPAKIDNLRSTEAMVVRYEQHGAVTVPVPHLPGGFEERIHFGRGEVLPRSQFLVGAPRRCGTWSDLAKIDRRR